jgi:hypothetical protein
VTKGSGDTIVESYREPIDYRQAVQQIQSRRRRRRWQSLWQRLPDPRPTSPAPVLLVGVALVLAGWFLPIAHLALLVGLALLIFGFLSGILRPRVRIVTWRNRSVPIAPPDTWTSRLYYIFYRR